MAVFVAVGFISYVALGVMTSVLLAILDMRKTHTRKEIRESIVSEKFFDEVVLFMVIFWPVVAGFLIVLSLLILFVNTLLMLLRVKK